MNLGELRTAELKGLQEAAILLAATRKTLVNDAQAIYAIVQHACDHVNDTLAEMLKGGE